MKLRSKLTIICAVFLFLTTTVLSGAMLWQVRERSYENIAQRTKENLDEIREHFYEALTKRTQKTASKQAQKVLVQYYFRSNSTPGSVLVMNGEILSASTPVDPRPYLNPELTEDKQVVRCQENGIPYVIVGDSLNWNASQYTLYLVTDASYINRELMQLLNPFLLLALCASTLGLLGIQLVIRRTLNPLSQLQKTARHIAKGNYSQRVQITSRDEVGLLADHFNHMAEAVDAHIQTLTEQNIRQRLFIGGVTHEFKTPLTSLLLNVDTLRTVYLPEEKQQELLESMDGQLRWLEQMVHKLLKLISLEKSTKIVPASVSELLEQTKQLSLGAMKKYGTKLEISCQADFLPMDQDLLCSALVNLIENSAKASVPGQTIRLRAMETILEVSDQGRGIPPEALSRITEPFYMGDSSRSKIQGGFGLGLALVKEIAAVHKADLEIQSTLGAGTTVRLIFQANGNQTVTQR